ncbi:hypothetical protein [Chthonomonas calidirosea]|uniref:hypothetical protein n=1 Tax=Chthonomonas calidirosea TaxID=454171 RepID=UPI000A4D2436|nr:hypothetical protein [Chthonomonas calidirosea]
MRPSDSPADPTPRYDGPRAVYPEDNLPTHLLVAPLSQKDNAPMAKPIRQNHSEPQL